MEDRFEKLVEKLVVGGGLVSCGLPILVGSIAFTVGAIAFTMWAWQWVASNWGGGC